MIPMMILSGAMFPFDKMNRSIGSVEKVPLIAEFMPTKWSFEALMVNQFKNNDFQKNFYDIEKRESNADFKKVYYLPELKKNLTYIEDNWYRFNEPEIKQEITESLKLLRKELGKEQNRTGLLFESLHQLDSSLFNEIILYKTSDYLNQLEAYYNAMFQKANTEKENIIRYLLQTNPELYRNKRAAYHNESVEDQVKKVYEKNKMLRYRDELVQQIDPVYKDPDIEGYFNFRAHFFAPQKYFAGQYRDTYWFNMIFVWVMTLFFYVTLYFDVLKKILSLPEYIRSRK